MTPSSLVFFAVAFTAILLIPGPVVIAMVARVLSRGAAGIPAFIAGCVCASLFWMTLAVTGLAAIAATFAALFLVIRYLGAAYLIYMAWKMWISSATVDTDVAPVAGSRLFLTGLSINLGNPKAVVFHMAILPSVVDIQALTLAGYAELVVVMATCIVVVLGAYAALAARARRLMSSPRAMRGMRRGGSVAMALAGAAIAVK